MCFLFGGVSSSSGCLGATLFLLWHSLSLPYNYSFISRFGFEGWIWVLVASVPDLCILFTFVVRLSVPFHFVFINNIFVRFVCFLLLIG